jgi:hypothetical protein
VARTKWNEPVIEADPYFVEMTADGPREGVRMAFCGEDIEMFREGYKCLDCLELLPAAFPDECFLCGFPVRAEQSRLFAERFAGSRAVGSRINEDEELERLARQRYEREKLEHKNSRIWVPGK